MRKHSLSLSLLFFFFWAAHKRAHFADSHRPEYERRPVRSDPHWLKLSTVRCSRLRLKVSLEATATTNNRRLALPFSLLTAPTVYKTWQLSVLTCCYWRVCNTGACTSVQLLIIVFFFFLKNVLKYLLPPVLVCPPVFLLLSLILVQYAAGGLWVGALFHQPGASVRVLFHFASWC